MCLIGEGGRRRSSFGYPAAEMALVVCETEARGRKNAGELVAGPLEAPIAQIIQKHSSPTQHDFHAVFDLQITPERLL